MIIAVGLPAAFFCKQKGAVHCELLLLSVYHILEQTCHKACCHTENIKYSHYGEILFHVVLVGLEKHQKSHSCSCAKSCNKRAEAHNALDIKLSENNRSRTVRDKAYYSCYERLNYACLLYKSDAADD